jgi:hypothetical protein
MRPPLLVGKSCSPNATAACCLATGGVGPRGISIYRHRFGLCWKGDQRCARSCLRRSVLPVYWRPYLSKKLPPHRSSLPRPQRLPFMDVQSNKYITTTVDIIRTTTTIDIMRTAYTDMVIGVIIEQERHYIRSLATSAVPRAQFRASTTAFLPPRRRASPPRPSGDRGCDGEVEN